MDRSRIRWRNVGRLAAGVAGGGVLLVVMPGLLDPPEPPPLPADVGLATGASGAVATLGKAPDGAETKPSTPTPDRRDPRRRGERDEAREMVRDVARDPKARDRNVRKPAAAPTGPADARSVLPTPAPTVAVAPPPTSPPATRPAPPPPSTAQAEFGFER
jgi:hypothetical protein